MGTRTMFGSLYSQHAQGEETERMLIEEEKKRVSEQEAGVDLTLFFSCWQLLR